MGPLLFNNFINDLFLISDNIKNASYIENDTPCHSHNNFEVVISRLERTAADLFRWFSNNGMKANAAKCHILLSTK